MIKLETFVKLMMMTTSDHDAEVLTAVRKANQLLKAEGKNWEELITGLVPIEREAQRRPPRTTTPPWAEDDGFGEVPPRGGKSYVEFVDTAFEDAMARVRHGTSFRDTIESIHTWWKDKGFLTDKQLKVVLKAAGREE